MAPIEESLCFTPSPLMGEGWGEGEANHAGFSGAALPLLPLTLALSRQGRGNHVCLELQLRLLNLLFQIPIQKLNHMDEHPKPFVLGLAVEEAVVDLLQDHHQPENAVHGIEVEVRHL